VIRKGGDEQVHSAHYEGLHELSQQLLNEDG
jgi:hypothetical protein